MTTKVMLVIHPKEQTDPEIDYYEDKQEDDFIHQYGTNHIINKRGRSILADLADYKLPDSIKEGADAVYNKMNYQVHRGKLRIKLLFYCVYCAYREQLHNNPCYDANCNIAAIDPIRLGKMFGLTAGEVSKCNSLFSPLQTGYKPPPSYVSPVEYLSTYCINLGLSRDSINEITSFARCILKKDRTLNQDNPQTVAAGLLKYFTVVNGIVLDNNNRIAELTGRSNATIDSMHRRISIIDNI